jgi:hypothetical protein
MACSMIRPLIGKKWMHGLATQPAAQPLVRPKNSTKELLVVIPDRPNVVIILNLFVSQACFNSAATARAPHGHSP